MILSGLLFFASGDRRLWRDRAIKLTEWHHFYLGVIIFALGTWVWGPHVTLRAWMCGEPSPSRLQLLGAIIASDDAAQHWIQVSIKPSYMSPLHRLFAWVYGWCLPLRMLERLLDRLMGLL